MFHGRSRFAGQPARDGDVLLTGEAAGDRRPDRGRVAEVVIGAPQHDAEGADAGRLYVSFGGAGLLSKGVAFADRTFTGEAAGDQFGTRTVEIADLDGDGANGLLNSAGGAQAGRVYVFRGRLRDDREPVGGGSRSVR